MWRWVGESAILVEYQGDLSVANAAAHAHSSSLVKRFAEIEEAVPGARTTLLRLAGEPSPGLKAALDDESHISSVRSHREPVVIACAFDGEDLPAVAEAAGLSPRGVVEAVVEARYSVALVGFMPGFPYLLGLPEHLHLPRRATPRVRIPAGSIAIAGPFAGVYPSASPGGWHLLGHTELRLFDAGNTSRPARLKPGQPVRMVEA